MRTPRYIPANERRWQVIRQNVIGFIAAVGIVLVVGIAVSKTVTKIVPQQQTQSETK